MSITNNNSVKKVKNNRSHINSNPKKKKRLILKFYQLLTSTSPDKARALTTTLHHILRAIKSTKHTTPQEEVKSTRIDTGFEITHCNSQILDPISFSY